jgi:hypothetical protein
LTRPTQWKDKAKLTDKEVEELKQTLAKFVDQGGDAIFGNIVQLALDAKDTGKFDQTSYDKTTGNYNQSGWPIATSTTGPLSSSIRPTASSRQ